MKIYAVPLTNKSTAHFCASSLKPTGTIFTLVAKFNTRWDALSKAKEGTYKKRLYAFGMRVMDKIDHQEWFLKRVHPMVNNTSSEMLTVLHPSILESSKVKHDLMSLVEKQVQFHRNYMYVNAVALPFTGILSILPMPNIPFFYFAFRVYSHYRAYLGGSHLQYIFKHNTVKIVHDKTIDRILGISSGKNIPKNSNNNSSNESPGPESKEEFKISPEAIHRLSQELQLPDLEIEVARALKQIDNSKPKSS